MQASVRSSLWLRRCGVAEARSFVRWFVRCFVRWFVRCRSVVAVGTLYSCSVGGLRLLSWCVACALLQLRHRWCVLVCGSSLFLLMQQGFIVCYWCSLLVVLVVMVQFQRILFVTRQQQERCVCVSSAGSSPAARVKSCFCYVVRLSIVHPLEISNIMHCLA